MCVCVCVCVCVYLFIYLFIYLKELADVILGAGKFDILQGWLAV